MKETEKRKRFFSIALQLINEKGFKAMTMRGLAKKLDCDVSNIYNYVKSKHALLEQLLFEISNKFHDGMSAIELSTNSPLEKLKAVISLHVQLTIESPYHVVLLVNEWRHLKPEKQQDFIEFRDTYEQKLKAIISQGIEQGELQSENLDFTTNCILSSIRWLYNWYNPDNYSINSNDLEQLMIGFVLNGVARNNRLISLQKSKER